MYRARTGLPWRDLPERFGPGSRSTTGSQTGRSEATRPRYFESCASRSTRPARFSMAPLFALTRRRRAEGGSQCFGTLSRRRFDQAPRRRRHPAARSPHALGGPAPRM
ncbi:MAG: transposase [Polyangiaceae bacterium]|nr:transposase [Polyangiaceae bacterium]